MTTGKATIPVQCGTMMVRDGLLLPDHMGAATDTYSAGWRSFTEADGFGVDRKLRQLGWECFFIAGELSAISFGLSQNRMVNAAVHRLLAKVRALNLNCVEFTEVRRSSFIGIPYVAVACHARQIQHGSPARLAAGDGTL
ncbi:MAG TPA: hypothetical protein VGR50_06765 [Terriglobales bacterium]|nr:hypothetical protein [Terriglobales bacterium]